MSTVVYNTSSVMHALDWLLVSEVQREKVLE
jgi:hypothetical protein